MATIKRRFSAEEEQQLYTQYGRVPIQRLARRMGRTVWSLELRAQALFNGRPVSGRWDQYEKVRMRQYLGVATVKQLMVIFRRTEGSVSSYVQSLRRNALGTAEIERTELAEFKLLYGSRTDHDLAAIFGRRIEVIEATAARLRLSKDKAFVRSEGGGTRMPRWDEGEIAALRKMYPLSSNREIAEHLGRSVKSVVSKAHALHLKKDYERLRDMGRENVAKRYV